MGNWLVFSEGVWRAERVVEWGERGFGIGFMVFFFFGARGIGLRISELGFFVATDADRCVIWTTTLGGRFWRVGWKVWGNGS